MTRRFLNGETYARRPCVLIHEYIVYEREPGELKHLSTRRKRKKTRFRKVMRPRIKGAFPIRFRMVAARYARNTVAVYARKSHIN